MLAGTAAASHSALETLRLRPVKHVSARALGASLNVFRARLRELGADASTVQLAGKTVVLRVPTELVTASNLRFLTRQALLEFFDLEASLAAGPSRKPLRPRSGRVQVSCAAPFCPGVRKTSPRRRYHYLFRGRPALTGASVVRPSVRADVDPVTGQALVLIRLDGQGQSAFAKLTARLADRGRRRGKPQSLAILLDRAILSFPEIDYRQYPNGIDPSNGVQIAGIGTIRQARDLARLLRTPSLPVAFKLER